MSASLRSYLGSTRRAGAWRVDLTLSVGLLLFVVCRSGAAQSDDLAPERLFDQANQRFITAESPAQFEEAAAMFQAVLDQGKVGSAVLFNLGNSWMRAGKPGRAIAAYRQASLLAPRDVIVESNLEMARASVGTTAPDRTWWSRVIFWQGWISASEKARAISVLLAIAVVLGLLGRLRRGPFLVRAAALLFAVTVLIAISLGVDLYEQRPDTHGVIIRQGVIAKKGAAESYADAFNETLREGTEFKVVSRDHDWVHVALKDGLDGWVPLEDVSLW